MTTARTALAVFSFSFTLMAADSFVGTWKLNMEKSRLQTNNIASETMKISEASSTSDRIVIDVVLKSGETQHQEFNRIPDGKEHPASGVGFKQEGATEIEQIVSPSTRKITSKRDGKVRGVIESSVSADGKVMTNHRTGGAGDEILVFERQ